jgi:hypothetical protein
MVDPSAASPQKAPTRLRAEVEVGAEAEAEVEVEAGGWKGAGLGGTTCHHLQATTHRLTFGHCPRLGNVVG